MVITEGQIIGKGSTLCTMHKVGETARAYIVELRQGNIVLTKEFLPKSLVKYKEYIFEIPDWLAKKLLIKDYVEVIRECAELRPQWLDELLRAIERIVSKEGA